MGRYPHAIGQVYAARQRCANGYMYPPFYLYPAGTNVYDFSYQMPVEECGNMLIMLESAISFGASPKLVESACPCWPSGCVIWMNLARILASSFARMTLPAI